MKKMKIIHCAYFKTLRIRGCFWAGMAYKLNNGLTRLGHQVIAFNDREAARALSLFTGKSPWSIRKTNELFAASPVKERDFCGKFLSSKEIAIYLQQNAPLNKFLFPRLYAPMLNGTDYFDTLARSGGVLNLSITNSDYLYSSDRMAHAMGNGCLTYIDRRTGFNDLFDEDEAAFFSSPDELIEKVEKFRKEPALRAQNAERGWRRYHDLFNEISVGKYVSSLLDGSFNATDYPFPTINEL